MHPTTAALIEGQREIHQVKYLIPDLPVRLYGNVQRHPPSWGLDRIDQRSNTLDGLYHYPSSAGENVTIYVVDTGVNVDHKDFEGRAEHGPVFVAGTDDNSDLNGHGTSVAALAAGSAYGVAKKARIVSLKTLDDTGAGRLSNVLAAIEWVVKRHLSQGRNTRSMWPLRLLYSLSLGAEHNEPTNAAIQEAMRLGIHFSIAAGNDGKNACRFSPASTPGVMTVGATDRDDTVASYSNWGPCVAIYAPGSDITSAWIGSKTATHVQSGTSMASPHVAGLIALLLSESPDESFPTGAMVDTILRTVTKVSMDYATVAGMPLPLPLSDQPEDSVWSKHQSPPEPYGNGLARSLVYVGASTSRRGNETEIEDPPATSSTSASASLMTDAMRGILLAVVCSLIIGT
ncbi:peptidase S8/S53 domain-containing protein [Mortierella sp. GBAus27b]|nr:peptidase S8/S53 domain-containing protein [Mortierella sp. GBAus27b]